MAFRRPLSGCLAGIFAAAQLLGVAHLAFVQHVACPEHGEWVEVAPRGRLAVGDAARSIDRRSSVEDRSISGAAFAPGGHDHCPLGATGRDPSLLAGPRMAGRARRPALVAVSARAADRSAASIPVLSFAPKSSPPA
jgi:hypothetical protein